MTPLVLGVEVGGTKLQAALAKPCGEIVHVRRGAAPAGGGAEAILAWLAAEVTQELRAAPEHGGTVVCIGVGFGGPVETATGTVLVSHQVPGWEGVPLKHWFEDRFGLPTAVANDSNAAGWAEYCRGAGRGTRHFMYMNIGSGIGGALVINGALHDGQGFGAGELGHTWVPDWPHSTPGAADKLENICSGWSIERRLRSLPDPAPDTPLGALCGGKAESLDAAKLGEAARQGDPVARQEIEHVAESLGLGIANAITLFHPERIALGGGVSLIGEPLLEPVRRHVREFAFGPYRDRYEIVPCQLGEAVVLVGAVLLAQANAPAAGARAKA